MKTYYLALAAALLFWGCGSAPQSENSEAAVEDTLRYAQESHLQNFRQLTFGGDNAEAYFSYDDKSLVLQRVNKEEGIPCDQIFVGKLPKSPDEEFELTRISNGQGRTTCAYFYPGDQTIIYSSTHEADPDCPPVPDMRSIGKYVWPLYSSYDLYLADLEGNIKERLTDNDVYDAEATLSPQGDKIVFTSTRDGDIELYTMDTDGSNVKRITHEAGYDGGAFFSPDGSKIIFRASRFESEEDLKEYQELLAQNLVAPTSMELYICNADGSEMMQITRLGGANWAPYFHPSGEKVIFASNHHVEGGRQFNLFMINLDGSGLEQITWDEQFDSFPMFSYDGKRLVFASNRNNGGTRETNLFIADWVE